jgi:hypothetical protein
VKDFNAFMQRLEMLKWDPPGHLDSQLLDVLAELGEEPQVIWDVVRSWNTANLDFRQLSCHETSTHYKWFVYYHSTLRYKVWLHQYKPLGERKVGHAEVPHNHRYSLASLIVRGGFTHHRYEQVGDGLSELPQECSKYTRGDAYFVDWRQVHRLSDVMDQTVTLVVESPVARHFSEAFYAESGEPSMFYDFIGMLSRLAADISSI